MCLCKNKLYFLIKYKGKTIKSLMKKNKELKQRNAEVEAVLKELLLQNEIVK